MTSPVAPLTLKRLTPFTARGAFGVLLWWGLPFCVTLERAYEAQRGTWQPKIPPGHYRLERTMFHRGSYVTWQVLGGPISAERRILIHKGNLAEHSEGCILVGEAFDPIEGQAGIVQSGKAFAELMTLTAELVDVPLVIEHV